MGRRRAARKVIADDDELGRDYGYDRVR